jgi:endonuclease YncB( thermonuclease family)
MRPGIFALTVAALFGLSFAIVAGGHAITANDAAYDPSKIEVPDETDLPPMDEDSSPSDDTQQSSPADDSVLPVAPESPTPAPENNAAPSTKSGELERIAPREPLSQLGLALPPKPPKPVAPEDWKGTPLYQPVASSAGQIEAKGYSIAIAGVEPVPASDECSFEGTSWPCGARARTAFRSWLRGRAVTCTVPPEPDRAVISADCRVGKEDVGAWLVANGWARAATGGPYAEAGEKAQSDKKGIFGPPPARVSVTLSPSTTSALPAPLPPPDESPVIPVEPQETVPVAPGAFPPAPTPPTGQQAPLQ